MVENLPIGLGTIADRAGTSKTTVEAVIGKRTGQHVGKQTEKRVQQEIEKEAKRVADALRRLSGGKWDA